MRLFLLCISGCLILCHVFGRHHHGNAALKAELSKVMQQIWNADSNSLTKSQFTFNYGAKIKTCYLENSSQRMLTYINVKAMNSISTFATFKKLFKIFNPLTGHKEVITAAEKRLIQSFLKETLKTKVMQIAWKYLSSKNLASKSLSAFQNQLYQMWFGLYSRHKRSQVTDSCGFEHVFMGEIKKGHVSGMHNWLKIYAETLKKKVTYFGYCAKKNPSQIKASFTYDSHKKDGGSMFIGTSPEIELAMYTICFLRVTDKVCSFKVNGGKIQIQTYRIDYVKNRKVVGTAYPIVY